MSELQFPKDNLFRGLPIVELRAEDDAEGVTLFGHFARFDTWNEIDSWYEGRFLERVAKGTFKKTFREQRDRIKVQFDHGYGLLGNVPIGVIETLREEAEGPYYEVGLYDTPGNRDVLVPLLQGRTMDGKTTGSALGASYRFRVTKEQWVQPKKATDANPEMLPERTIQEVTLHEFGPVVWPADPGASAGVRSLTAEPDLTGHYLKRQAERTGQTARAAADFAAIAGAAPSGTPPEPPNEPPPPALGGIPLSRLRAIRAGLL